MLFLSLTIAAMQKWLLKFFVRVVDSTDINNVSLPNKLVIILFAP